MAGCVMAVPELISKPGRVLLSPSTKALMVAACSIFLGTIVVTYSLCAFVTEECPVFLPTISQTWAHVPGNYISRVAVSVGSALLFAANFLIYYSNTLRASTLSAEERIMKRHSLSNGTMLAMANAAIFLLSWIGSICDSHAPACRGLNILHSTIAVLFFILYDVYLIFLLAPARLEKAVDAEENKLLRVLITGSRIAKLRWFLPLNQTGIAVFEWLDVGCIAVFTSLYVLRNCGSIRFGVAQLESSVSDLLSTSALLPEQPAKGKGARAGADVPVVCLVSLQTMTRFLLGLAAFVTVVPWGAAMVHNPQMASPPDISETWIQVPGDLIARWGAMATAQALVWVQVCLVFSRRGWSNVTYANLLVGVIAAVALGLAGVVSLDEDDRVHRFAAITFFATSVVDMGLASVEMALCWPATATSAAARRSVAGLCAIFAASVLLNALVFRHAVDLEALVLRLEDVSPWALFAYQGTQAALLAAFFHVQVNADPSNKRIGLAFYKTA